MKRKGVMTKTKKTAFSALMAALSVAILYLGAVVDVLDLTAAALASMLVVFAVIEMGKWYACGIYFVATVLGLLLLPNKLPAVFYGIFAGFYPIMKAAFERLHYAVGWVLKLSLFNMALLGVILVTKYVLKMPEELELTWVLMLVGNVTFLVYDIALTKLITLYLVKLRKRLGLKNYFEN